GRGDHRRRRRLLPRAAVSLRPHGRRSPFAGPGQRGGQRVVEGVGGPGAAAPGLHERDRVQVDLLGIGCHPEGRQLFGRRRRRGETLWSEGGRLHRGRLPNRLLVVQMKKGVVIDGISDGLFKYSNFGKDFGIAVPTDVIDFSNLSSLPPIYTVVSVDASRCASPCVVSAVLKNLGGLSGARAHSTVTFTMTG